MLQRSLISNPRQFPCLPWFEWIVTESAREASKRCKMLIHGGRTAWEDSEEDGADDTEKRENEKQTRRARQSERERNCEQEVMNKGSRGAVGKAPALWSFDRGFNSYPAAPLRCGQRLRSRTPWLINKLAGGPRFTKKRWRASFEGLRLCTLTTNFVFHNWHCFFFLHAGGRKFRKRRTLDQ